MIIWWTILIALVIFLSVNKRYRWFYILYKTLPRDLLALKRFTKLNWILWKWERYLGSIPKTFHALAKKHPHKVAFYYEDQKWTFREVEEFSNQIAHYFKSLGFKKGDSIALILENRPEYVAIWLGLSKIGVITALINTNLVSDPLVHSISVAHSKALIYGSDFTKAVYDISDKIKDLPLFELGDKDEILPLSTNLTKEMKNHPKTVPDELSQTSPRDKIIYIYTSGTTGLPKAAVISNTRFMYASAGANCLAGLTENDVYYNPLPLYHTAGGMLAAGQALAFGVTVALRRKFSATNYWTDCEKYNCTVANYIGEICRYLLAAHKPETKVNHPVKKMLGNGLRPQIWDKFRHTFNIENIYEIYGSTEGNSNLVNIDNTVGAVGFIPRYATIVYSVTLVRCDEATGKPIRNQQGLCRGCAPNEAGILVGKINPKRAISEFEGYADKEATEKKILRDVFEKGDVYFNSGDVLVQDEFGYYFFKDRTGDTFRWKGENVATSEIEAVISNVAELNDSVVYGVQIPGTEGRAGMAAIVDTNNTLDLKKLASGLKSRLPSYSVPVLLRIMDSIPLTGTYKMKKTDLQREGFDIEKIKDHKLYYYNAKNSEYVPLTEEIFDDIMKAKLKL